MPIGAFRLNTVSKLIAEATVIYARTAKTVTAVNNAQVSTAQSKFGGASALFDGTGDYLQTNTSSDYLLGTGDFTVECWFRIAGNSAQAQDGNRYASLFAITNGNLAANSVGLSLVILGNSSTTGTGIQLYKNTNTEENITATVSISQTTWHHAAVSKSGSSVRIFFNGTQVGSTTTSNTIWGSSTFFGRVGRLFDTGFIDDINGHIDELRLSNTARYTSSFTPTNIPFVNDNNTVLLIHANGANASTTFTDDNISHRLPVNVFGDAQLSTAQSKFGQASMLFDGTGDYLKLGSYPDLNLTHTSDWTIELWARFNSVSSGSLFGKNQTSSPFNGYRLDVGINNSGRLAFYPGTGAFINFSDSVTTATWYHIAIVNASGTIKMYLNGNQQSSTITATSAILDTSQTLTIGSYVLGNADFFNGWMDEVRVSNTARYTGNFTPATAQFEPDANTMLLIHGDGTTLGTQIYNDVYAPPAVGHQSKGIIPYGNAQISTAQSKFGGSSYLGDGTGDYLQVSNDSSFTFGTSDFTIEFWLRLTSNSGTRIIWDQRPSGSQGLQPTIYQTGGTLYYYTNSGNRITSTSTLADSTWYHIAVSRSGTSTRMFINGAQTGSTYSDSNNYITSSAGVFIGADQFSTGSNSVSGHIDELRISNNARYTGTFTPTTVPFQSDANTVLLLHCDGANTSTRFVDDGSNPAVLDNVVIHASATSTASTITIPATAATGDYAVLFDVSTTTTNTIPSGWTSIVGTTTTGIRTNVSYKRLLSGDPNTSVTGMAGTTRKIMLIVKGDTDLLSVSLSTPGSQATTATPTNQTISSTGQVTPTIFFAVYAATGSISTRGWTGGSPTEYSSVSTSGIYVKALTYGQNTTPANATISMSDGGTNTLQSFSMKFA
jgi:Concanavalin A-like lectin/glucanases superfamily